MSEQQLELRWNPVAADWADAMRAVTPMFRWAPWFAIGIGLFGAVLVFLDLPLPGLFGLACGVLIAAMPAAGVYLSFRRNPVAATTVTATVDEQSVRMMTIDGSAYTDLRWSELSGWLETPRGFVLRDGQGSSSPMYPVPARAFDKDAELTRFRELLERQLGAADRK